jgi:histidyl-tRNA synthetase
MKHQAPRGTRDLLPEDLPRWQLAEARARTVLERYGYGEIRTPIFEDYELFARSAGESSDVVQKEMYRFESLSGGHLFALRPENTAGVCRAYLEQGLGGRGRIHRLWYAGPMFRYSRPQKGRYRQFFQIGAELIGSSAPGADVEMIALFVDVFEAWGFRDLTIAINSVGTPESRRLYGEKLREWLAPMKDQLSKDSQARFEINPMRILDTKDEGDLALLQQGPPVHMLDVLDPADREHFDAVRRGLETLGIAHEIDHGLVRGLDYYTRTAFEVHDRSLGAQSALGGGGRYDGLIEMLDGPATPGIGFSIGLDRAMLVLEQRGEGLPEKPRSIFVAAMDSTRDAAIRLVRELRRHHVVDCDVEARGFGAQMKAAGKGGAALLVLVGEDEWKRGEVVLKDLATGEQRTVKRADLDAELRKETKVQA